MNLVEYKEQCKRTLPILGEKMDLCHMMLGIGSEYNELQDAIYTDNIVNIGEELTDMIWYISNYCNLRGWNVESIWAIQDKEDLKTLPYTISVLQDRVKKYVAYNKYINPLEEVKILGQLCSIIENYFKFYNLDLERCLQNNIDKLRVRYPEKFTEHAAINRDIDSEIKELSK